MKQYFNFTLSGKKFFSLWITYFLIYCVPNCILQDLTKKNTTHQWLFQLIIILFSFVSIIFSYYFAKIMINNTLYKEKPFEFSGKLNEFLKMSIGGYLLTIITFGIYGVWFIRNITRYFIENTAYESEKFAFNGKVGKLALIFWLVLMAPCIVLSIIFIPALKLDPKSTLFIGIFSIAIIFLIIPFMYLFYKWIIDVNYKNFHIYWNTEFCPSTTKIFIEMLLTLCTVGIYFPMAWLRLYHYFLNKTVIKNDEKTLKIGFENGNSKNDFLLIWGQMLLCFITAFIYYPWAIEKIGKRIASKTYTEELK